jgi:hypothetical protein
VATAKPHKYSLECFIRDMEPIMDTVRDRPIADRVESLLEHLMEGAGFLDDMDRKKLGETGFSHIDPSSVIRAAYHEDGTEPCAHNCRRRALA